MTKEELVSMRGEKEKAFEVILDAAKEAERELTESEAKEVESLKAERSNLSAQIEELDKEADAKIKEAEKAEKEALRASEEAKEASIKRELENELDSIKRELVDVKEQLINKNERKMNENKLFDEVKRQLDSSNGSQVITLNERAAVDGDTAAMSASIPNYVEALDIIGYKPLWQEIGADVMNGASGTFTLPYESPIVGEKLAELASVTGDVTTPDGVLVNPNRFAVQKTFTLETLNSATPEFINAVIADMVKGCDRAITAEVYTKSLAAATIVPAGAITKAGFDALMGGADVENDGSFLSSRSSFFEAKGVAIDAGSGRFLVERAGSNGRGLVYDGTPYWYSQLFDDGTNQQYVVYADLSKVFIANYGVVDVIVDKYTLAGKGQVIITVNKLANVSIKNPYAFVKTSDLDPA